MRNLKSIILKLSGEILSTEKDIFNEKGFSLIYNELTSALSSFPGLKIGIVIGGGNIYRGRTKIFSRVSGDTMGMLATVINSIALKDYFSGKGLKARVFTPFLMTKIGEVFTVDAAFESFTSGNINIYAGGTGNPFFSTDSLAVLRALETNADMVLKATKVDGVYDSDPKENKNAKKFNNITHVEVVQKKLNVMDLPAISLALESNLEIFVFDFFKPGNLKRVISGELELGTLVKS
ncbi:MAG: UMP kinase [bacterium]|nr:UMP kinase [bacterium]